MGTLFLYGTYRHTDKQMDRSRGQCTLLILTGKNCQRIPPGTLNMFLRLWMITELAQMKIFSLKVLQPGGAAIIFPKSGRNQNPTPL